MLGVQEQHADEMRADMVRVYGDFRAGRFQADGSVLRCS